MEVKLKFLLFPAFLSISICAQPADGPPDPEASTPSCSPLSDEPQQSDSAQPANGKSDRLLFAMPNFLTVQHAGDAPPLSAGEKFKLTAQGSFDYFQFFWYGALAGISQARDGDSSYGEGAEGYAKRYAEHFADGTIENFMVKAIFPTVLHQDPRYFQMGEGTFGRRSWYAVSRIFVTRGDSGHTQFNFSEVLGAGSAAAISTYSYHPKNDRTLATVGAVWGTQMAYDALSLFLKEFWPDIQKKMRKSKSQTP
jgi:hypothetical protein